jgi:hypothetical protein
MRENGSLDIGNFVKDDTRFLYCGQKSVCLSDHILVQCFDISLLSFLFLFGL